MTDETITILRIIARKSPYVGEVAKETIQAIENNSPTNIQARLNYCAHGALGDPGASFTSEERKKIESLMSM